MPLMTLCASHAPFVMKERSASSGYEQALASAAQQITTFAPDLIIEFSTDHFNGLFYDLMPNFCVGIKAMSVGDWGTTAGPLAVPEEDAINLVHAIRNQDVDVDLSYRLEVDHGTIQLPEIMFGDINRYPLIPIVINCVGIPPPSFRRARMLGAAVGHYAVASGKRVLIMASGGLSHDPPIPQLASANAQKKEFLICGRHPSAEAREAREQHVTAAAQAFAAGGSPYLAPSPKWDNDFMKLLSENRLTEVDHWQDEIVTEQGGCGAHEVRTWIAAFAAQSAAGNYSASIEYYDVVPHWMTGMGVMTATQTH